jgi:hypothetical protein
MTFHKKPGMAFWATVVVVVVLAYPLSFGPACWLCEKGVLPQRTAWTIFRPITWLALQGTLISKLIVAFAEACGDQRRTESVFTNPGRIGILQYAGERCRSDSVSPIDYETEHRFR